MYPSTDEQADEVSRQHLYYSYVHNSSFRQVSHTELWPPGYVNDVPGAVSDADFSTFLADYLAG